MKFPLYFSVCLLLVFAGCDLFTNEQPEIPGKLVFSTPDGNGHYQIYTSLTNGENRKKLTHFKNDQAYSPSWSPDGKQIVFGRTTPTTSPGYYISIMNADGSDKQQLEGEFDGRVVNVVGDHPKWSPDGNKIAYDQCINCELGGGNSEIFMYDLKNKSITQITDTLSDDSNPLWNENENRISFNSDREYFATEDRRLDQDLFDILPDGTGLRKITTDGKTGFWLWDSNTESYLIKRNSNPILWYSLDPVSKDTIDLPQITCLTQSVMNDFVPLEFSKDGKILWTIKLQYPVFNFYFFYFKTKDFKKGLQIENISGFDWYYNENDF